MVQQARKPLAKVQAGEAGQGQLGEMRPSKDVFVTKQKDASRFSGGRFGDAMLKEKARRGQGDDLAGHVKGVIIPRRVGRVGVSVLFDQAVARVADTDDDPRVCAFLIRPASNLLQTQQITGGRGDQGPVGSEIGGEGGAGYDLYRLARASSEQPSKKRKSLRAWPAENDSTTRRRMDHERLSPDRVRASRVWGEPPPGNHHDAQNSSGQAAPRLFFQTRPGSGRGRTPAQSDPA
ncbi:MULTISPECIES: hypothetical protein [Brevundimonas]|uniref:hypothetical protein n=1 Tax=Brevundimonas TaxID=41275 RepID=UPI0025BCD26A|nr:MULTISPECIES: hypothetical protein [Brevundimonas]